MLLKINALFFFFFIVLGGNVSLWHLEALTTWHNSPKCRRTLQYISRKYYLYPAMVFAKLILDTKSSVLMNLCSSDFPVYHTAFDSYDWMITYGDCFFQRHVAGNFSFPKCNVISSLSRFAFLSDFSVLNCLSGWSLGSSSPSSCW